MSNINEYAKNLSPSLYQQLKQAVESGKISAAQVADQVLQSIREKHFYILTHSKIKPAIETRFQDILLERPPIDTSKR